jgi:hypothetical protein
MSEAVVPTLAEDLRAARKLVHNVSDRRHGWIGSWETEPLDFKALRASDVGRTVIYQDHGRAEAGTLTSWRTGLVSGPIVFARYSSGDTAAGADPGDLCFGVRPLDGNLDHAKAEEAR